MKCNHDCFNCPFPDCVNNYVDTRRYSDRSEVYKAYDRARQKARREAAKAAGLCIICQKRPAAQGAKCLDCYLRQKRYDRAKWTRTDREEWKAAERCYFCGAERLPGQKVCRRHYRILTANITICQQANRERRGAYA